MEKELINKINALAKKQREEGLTVDEKELQKKLRQQYLNEFRNNFKQILNNVEIVD